MLHSDVDAPSHTTPTYSLQPSAINSGETICQHHPFPSSHITYTITMEAHRSWLEELPVELQAEIANYLEGPDLIAFRQASPELAAAASGAFGTHFLPSLTTDLSRRSLSRLLGAVGFPHHRRRDRVLHIVPWAQHRMSYVQRPNDWARDAATGRLDLATPTGRAVLSCIRDGFHGYRSFAISDEAWNDPGVPPPPPPPPPQQQGAGGNDRGPMHLYPTDALALVVALAADPTNPAPVTALEVSLRKRGIDEPLLDPEALRRANWDSLKTLRFDVEEMADPADPAVRPFIHTLLDSALNLETVEIRGGEVPIACCVALLSQQQRVIRSLKVGGRRGRLSGASPLVLRDWMESNLGGDKLESLEFDCIYLEGTSGDVNPWEGVLARVHAAFPNLKRFKMMRCGMVTVAFEYEAQFMCPLFQILTARLGPARTGCPSGDCVLSHGRCCAAFSDEHGGTFRLMSVPQFVQLPPGQSGPLQSTLHDFDVEYELGPEGAAEGMRGALSDMAQGMTRHSQLDPCPGRLAPDPNQA
ncbi:hypothetical protein GGTG_10165 [Gaeumannomyces tritici R3-111a-1]|uniref:F-box domain-containing protein n=1 Tax=Gaeumannomyces tritici (strain R3-111a-1) TaxID=644352 RepID=J3P9I5_GAET3|nr:hypothetical protein GGTG_10165 [Gaeumannomyces tritici R3-111a-1]EJT73321.1 hypothetical protein GGTG_10165 [Gaeumannomyces tritici R3-111a-1]